MSAPEPTLASALPAQTWINRFARLGDAFHASPPVQPLPQPVWVARSPQAAQWLGADPDTLFSDHALQVFAGNTQVPGMHAVATVYSGHQFGVWAGQLGDGRALLLGELATPHLHDTPSVEVQLKGAGRTPFSRMGDGRAVLRSSIREFLASEAMHALGIPTTRALCVVGSPQPVYREAAETAAVVTRLAPSFIRFGHFEHFSHHGLHDELRQLTDFVLDHFYPHCRTQANPVAAMLGEVAERTAAMVALWQSVGFCHGVMNTDNMSILGLTIDYGPFQFMDGFDPAHICNHSDSQGRYAFSRQPSVAYWNLMALGQALLPLIGDSDAAIAALDRFKTAYPAHFEAAMARKLGFGTPPPQGPLRECINSLLHLLAAERMDYTVFWRRLTDFARTGQTTELLDHVVDRGGMESWLLSFSELHAQFGQGPDASLMARTNPRFVLRNYMAQQAIERAETGDFSVVNDLLKVLAAPYDEHPAQAEWAHSAPDWAAQISLSCSS
ncbi:YdiU family protein [Curvibacter sp. APW13]|uniref:protein adenylyltransferase SelO n=1 Tax=Curvibacter sp. APW13 TaxID=3077236 RepID=UPI0028E00CB1|nr:YdiU family protein [Curvibacter sp. APW13]MDT8991611.1 YdiU family protein [Curvibacter sp. APW13]